jgi:hypothetical protein
VEINGTAVPTSAIETHESEDPAHGVPHLVGRVDLGKLVTPGVSATLVFKQRNAADDETDLWIPGIQMTNDRGARYPVDPVGSGLITLLHQKHAPECDYDYFDLATGDLTLSFTPNP